MIDSQMKGGAKRRAGFNHLISNKREWNNCYIKNQQILLDFADFAWLEQPEGNLVDAISQVWYNGSYNPTNIFARARLVKTRHVSEYSPDKTGEYPRIFPNFQNCACCIKDLMDNKDNSLHLGRKYARIFVLGHYLFLVAHSFPRATLSENCSLLGTDNVRGQIS